MNFYSYLKFIFRGLKAQYRSQKQEIKLLTAHLKSNQTAVDVGANKGHYLLALSKAVPFGKVYAFEPQPILASYLSKICVHANFNNVQVENIAASDSKGTSTLYIPGEQETSQCASLEETIIGSEPKKMIEVEKITLDEYFADKDADIGAMKIDVEGHELRVIKGALETIKKHHPIIVCECQECHQTTGTVTETLNFIAALNYDVYLITNNELLPVAKFDPAIHQVIGGPSSDYYNNFVCFPK